MILDIYKPAIKFGLHSSYYMQKVICTIKEKKDEEDLFHTLLWDIFM